MKHLAGDHRESSTSPVVNMDESWITNDDFAKKFNRYLIYNDQVLSFPNATLSEIEVHTVHNYLHNITSTKSTISEDFPSWISKNKAHILSGPTIHIKSNIPKW